MTATDTDLDALLDQLAARAAARALERPVINQAGEVVGQAATTGRLVVNSGDTILATWGNTTFDQTVECFASNADRDNQWPAPHDGAMAYTADYATVWARVAGVWKPLAGAGQAPTTGGSNWPTYTDAMGNVWVSRNGVNGGAWRRATDVLHARWYRAAAWSTLNNAAGIVAFDTATRDPYALYQTSSNQFVAPIAGLWRLTAAAQVTLAVGQYLQLQIWYNNSAAQWAANQYAGVAGGTSTVGSEEWYLNAGESLAVYVRTPAVCSGVAGSLWTSAAFDYLGTG